MSARRPPQWVLCPFYRTSGADAVLIPAMFLRSILLGAAATVLFAAPAAAEPFLTPLQPCYVVAQKNQRELVHIDATGFTKLGKVDIVVDDTILNTAEVLYDGSVHGTFPAPFVDADQRDFTVRLSEQGNPANTVTEVSKVTKFSVTQTPRSARTSQRVRFKGRGFMAPTYVWAHYVFNGRS